MCDLPKFEEIEVTPEMIEAGTEELFNYNPDMETGSSFVTRLYRAMKTMDKIVPPKRKPRENQDNTEKG